MSGRARGKERTISLVNALQVNVFNRNGILDHELFQGGAGQGRTFALCICLIFIEGILLFSYIIFYPVL